MTFREFFRSLRRGVWFVLASIVVCVGLAIAYVVTTPKTYTATAELFVSAGSPAQTLTESFNGSQFINNRMPSYARLAVTDDVTQPVVSSLRLPLTPAELADKIDASVPLDTGFINLSVSDGSAGQAARIANNVADRLVEVVAALESPKGNGEGSPVRLTVVRQATAPTAPSSPKAALDVALAFVAGLAIGTAISLVRYGVTPEGAVPPVPPAPPAPPVEEEPAEEPRASRGRRRRPRQGAAGEEGTVDDLLGSRGVDRGVIVDAPVPFAHP